MLLAPIISPREGNQVQGHNPDLLLSLQQWGISEQALEIDSTKMLQAVPFQ